MGDLPNLTALFWYFEPEYLSAVTIFSIKRDTVIVDPLAWYTDKCSCTLWYPHDSQLQLEWRISTYRGRGRCRSGCRGNSCMAGWCTICCCCDIKKAEGHWYENVMITTDKIVHLGGTAAGKACADGNICALPGAGLWLRTNASLEVDHAKTWCNWFCTYKVWVLNWCGSVLSIQSDNEDEGTMRAAR